MYKLAIFLSVFISLGAQNARASEMIFHCRAFGAVFEVHTSSPWRAYSDAFAFLVQNGFPNHPQTLRAISCRLHRA